MTILPNVGKGGGKKKQKKNGLTWKEVADWMSRIYGKRMPESSVRTNFQDLKKKEKKVKNSKKEDNLQAFYRKTYTPPNESGKRKLSTGEILDSPEHKSKKHEPFEEAANLIAYENAELKKQYERLIQEKNQQIDSLRNEIQEFKQGKLQQVESLKTEIHELTQKNLVTVDKMSMKIETLKQQKANLTNALSTSRERLKNVYKVMGKISRPKYLMQSIQRKNASIGRWRNQVIQLKKDAKKSKSCKTKLETKSVKLLVLQQRNNNKNSRDRKKKNTKRKPQVNTAILTESLNRSLQGCDFPGFPDFF